MKPMKTTAKLIMGAALMLCAVQLQHRRRSAASEAARCATRHGASVAPQILVVDRA